VTIQAFRHEEVVKIGDDALRLVLNFRALDAIESETQRPFDTILNQLTTRGAIPPTSLVSRVVWGLLREYHPEIDIDQATGLTNGASAALIGVAMGKLFETAFPRAAAPDPKAKSANPRKPRGASRPSSSRGAPQT
jgi:hypothetical protein